MVFWLGESHVSIDLFGIVPCFGGYVEVSIEFSLDVSRLRLR